MTMDYTILVINPGSTSTKLALYQNDKPVWNINLEHDSSLLKKFRLIYDQLDMRYHLIIRALQEKHVKMYSLSAVVARGGLLGPVSAGAYEVSDQMIQTLREKPVNHHASNLGAALAQRIASPLGIPAYIYDPVTVDEMIDIVRITGLKEVMRHGQCHNLNMRAASLRLCKEQGLDYKKVNIIVAHLGGGITLTLHSQGKIIDMVSDDEGPFAPERAGLIPDFRLARYISEHDLNYDGIMEILQRRGGLVSHLGSSDCQQIEARISAGDQYAKLVYDAMALNIAKSIASLASVVRGNVNHIILTGGIANSVYLTHKIISHISFLAETVVYPGENEMEALALGALRVLKGEEEAQIYTKNSADIH